MRVCGSVRLCVSVSVFVSVCVCVKGEAGKGVNSGNVCIYFVDRGWCLAFVSSRGVQSEDNSSTVRLVACTSLLHDKSTTLQQLTRFVCVVVVVVL